MKGDDIQPPVRRQTYFPELAQIRAFGRVKVIKKRLRISRNLRNPLSLNHRVFHPTVMTIIVIQAYL